MGKHVLGQDLGNIFVKAGQDWVTDKAPRLAAALAFYTILSLAPLLVIAAAIAGVFFGEEAARGEIVNQLRGLIGSAGAEVVQTTLQNANKPRAGLIASLIGIITLLFGASGVFGELQDALNKVWKVPPQPGKSWGAFLKSRFLSFAMIVAVGFLLLVSLLISALLSVFATFIQGMFPNLTLLLRVVNFAFSISIISALFALMFRYLPDITFKWREIIVGALLTAVLFTMGKYLIGLYLRHAGVATPYGAAGSVVAFVVWTYYSGLIFFYGAEFTQVLAHKRLSE